MNNVRRWCQGLMVNTRDELMADGVSALPRSGMLGGCGPFLLPRC